MKKILSIIILIFIATVAFVSCKANEKIVDEPKTNVSESTISSNSALKIVSSKGGKINDLAIALILNSPEKSQLDQVSNLNKHVIEESKENILIIPMKNGSDIRLEKVKYENDKFITESIVMENKNTPDGYGLYLTVNIPSETSNFLSIQYSGISTYKGAAHPTNEFYTTNINMKTGKRLKLTDIVKIDDEFIKRFRNSSYIALEPGNSELEAAVKEYVNNISKEDLIEYFKQADNKIEENPSHTYSYLTEDSIVISVNVPHAIGDHVEYKIINK